MIWQIALVVALVALNALLAGTELAMVSLRESQVNRLEAQGRRGAALARLVRDPNRFLATIQVGITLAGFLASAAAAVSLAEPLVEPLGFLGRAAEPIAVVIVTLALSYLSLVVGELAPKRLAMQRAESWALRSARPLAVLATAARPVVWLLGRSTDVVVRLLGGDPAAGGTTITEEELRDLVATESAFSPEQRSILEGAFEVADRTLRQVLRPRQDVVSVIDDQPCADALRTMLASVHSRAPVTTSEGSLDHVVGVVHLRDLLERPEDPVASRARPSLFLPETLGVLEALRDMQAAHQQLAVVVDEHGSAEGIVTVEDLLEELVGEIYDESDRDVLTVQRVPGGGFLVPGRFPAHDLVDLGLEVPPGAYATVAGLVLDQLGRIPEGPGDVVEVEGWRIEVMAVDGRAITLVKLRPPAPGSAPGGG